MSRLWATAGWYTSVLAIWLVAGTALAWGWLPGRWRRLVAILTSAAGLGFLLVAVNSEGLREAPTVGVFLMGTLFTVLNFENGLGVISLSAYWQSVIRGLMLLVVVVLQATVMQRRHRHAT